MADVVKTRKESKQEASDVFQKLGLSLCDKCVRCNTEAMNSLLGRLHTSSEDGSKGLEVIAQDIKEIRDTMKKDSGKREERLADEKKELSLNRKKLNEVLEEVRGLTKKIADVDLEPLSNKVDTATKKWSDLFKERVDELSEGVKKIHHSVLTEKGEQASGLQLCLKKALDAKTQDDKDEEADKLRRRTSVVVYGLRKSSSSTPDKRKSEDKSKIEELLKLISCDDVEIVNLIRLGKRIEGESEPARPRPLKLVLKNENQQSNLLKLAKNLRMMKEGGWSAVFIHRDMTPKEREARKLLVESMKQRIRAGETNLFIAGDRIVTRRLPVAGKI